MNVTWQTAAPAPPIRIDHAAPMLPPALEADGNLVRMLRTAGETGEPILLLVNDPDRSTPTRPVLIAIAELSKKLFATSGTRRAREGAPRFRALVATGTHQFSDQVRRDFEHRTFHDCGLDVQAVAWHDARDNTHLPPLGEFRMHQWVLESRFLLPIGSCEPHYFAGVTGPHKTLTIGCMAFDDIQANHARAMSPDADLLHLEGNPVYEGIKRVLARLSQTGRTICAVAQVAVRDRLIAVRCGEPLEVLTALLPVVRSTYTRKITEPVDVVRLRVPPPLGRTLYQADKAIKNNQQAVRPGGAIILEADCSGGIGPDAFLSLLRRTHDCATAQRIVDTEGYRLGDHKALKLRQIMDPAGQGVRLAVVSKHLSPNELAGTGIRIFDNVEAGLQWTAQSEAKDSRCPPAGALRNGLIVEDAGILTVSVEANP